MDNIIDVLGSLDLLIGILIDDWRKNPSAYTKKEVLSNIKVLENFLKKNGADKQEFDFWVTKHYKALNNEYVNNVRFSCN